MSGTTDRRAGIDLGARTLRAVVAEDGSIVGRASRPTPRGPTGAAITEAVIETLDAALDNGGFAVDSLDAIGVASIGPLDREVGVVVDPPTLPRSVSGIRLREPLEEHAGVPVQVDDDATAGLIGERAETESPPSNMVFLYLSTGISAGIAVDGRVLRGWGDNAGAVGHVVVDPESDLQCSCGRPGHWDAFASGSGIPDFARSVAEEFDGDTDIPLSSTDLGAEDVFSLAGTDVLADMVIHRLARVNAVRVATITATVAPEVVSIGGQLALENPTLVIAPIRDRVPSLLTTRVPEIRQSRLGGDAVLYGALAIARRDGE
ncbi:MAG: ROK family protein [Halodesulfurarchaeum sp.]